MAADAQLGTAKETRAKPRGGLPGLLKWQSFSFQFQAMSEFVQTSVAHGTAVITLDRPKALNSLSLEMVRALTEALTAWRDDAHIDAVVIRSSSEKALCAGGDIRFFYDEGKASPTGNSELLDQFFTEEYALNHLIHFYPKPFIAVMDGVVMGGGMGIAQAGPKSRVRLVTERTKMAMPEVNIGLFPDVGGSYFLSRVPGQLGNYLGLTGLTIGAADALYVGLADYFVPSEQLPALADMIANKPGVELREAVVGLGMPFWASGGVLARHRALIDTHFGQPDVAAIMASLAQDSDPFAQKALAAMQQRSPLMMCVTHKLLKLGATLDVADCLRLERNLVRRNFEHGEVIEGVRALVIDKDNKPVWNPPTLDGVTQQMVDRFFEPVWAANEHPLASLK
jgi:enoyl-CoA hydratase/carnithine racemase